MSATRGEHRDAARPPTRTLPFLTDPAVSATVGVGCGLLAVLLVCVSERGCEAVRGRATCGGGAGLSLLVVVVVVTVAAGYLGLKQLHVDSPGLVAFFGVALPLIMVMAFMIDSVFSAWMILILPLLAAVCFALSALLSQALEHAHEAGYMDDARPIPEPDDAGDGGFTATAEPAATRGGRPSDLPHYAPPGGSPATLEAHRDASALEHPMTTASHDAGEAGLVGDDGAPLLRPEPDPVSYDAEGR
ncbi:MAG: hypothetical protein ACRDPG_00900 [Nocardioidaceae bacterium]